MPKYLQKRRRRWYAILEIPLSLRGYFGKPRFVQSLGTESQTVAEVRVHSVISEWKSWIDAARKGDKSFDADVVLWRKEREKLRKAGVPAKEAEEALFNIAVDSVDPDRGVELLHTSSGKWIRLSAHIDEYIASLKGLNAPKTIDMKRSDIKRFAKQFDYAHDVTKRGMIDWVENDLIAQQGLSAPTCNRIVSAIRGYWEHLERHKDLQIAGPFKGIVPNRKTAQRQSGKQIQKRSHFIPEDYRKLMAECAGDPQLSDLIRLGAYTGCRIEELCSLTLEKVRDEKFVIEDAKTDAGWRTVPNHPHIAQTVARLRETSTDGYLLSGLSFNKYGDRSNAIGKRFGRLKSKCGYGSSLVFHSFRKGVATQLETAGVPENVTARLLGHEFHTMSYGLYSGGVSLEVLRCAILKLDWGV